MGAYRATHRLGSWASAPLARAIFLRNLANGIATTDLVAVPTVDFRLLYCLIVLGTWPAKARLPTGNPIHYVLGTQLDQA